MTSSARTGSCDAIEARLADGDREIVRIFEWRQQIADMVAAISRRLLGRNPVRTAQVPPLSNEALAEINDALPWFAGTQLPDGRILGRVGARLNKRDSIETVPDKRIMQLHDAVDLSRKSVLEIGCFEGIHTLGLASYCADLTAVDIRPLNVAKTLVRLSAHGKQAEVFTADIEEPRYLTRHFDVVFHCGVLYHLEDPVTHLQQILKHCNVIYLDTHIVEDDHASDAATFAGRAYVGHWHIEGGWHDPFSGRAAAAFWLRQRDIEQILLAAGFSVEIWSLRSERNGARIGMLGKRRRRNWSIFRPHQKGPAQAGL